ncbi:MAG: L,D-transpeptidase [Deltaproteobacteria bacterium]|nr:L,D-transpeptidase [Deltaproteobacteria bacterium]
MMRWAPLAIVAVLSSAGPASAALESPCDQRPKGVIVDVDARRLYLCLGGAVDAAYPVNLGRGGIGKRRQGDRKTPLGRYRLLSPRASASGFTWFVPIAYPTPEQRRAGYTGGAIGIHGPPDWLPTQVVNLAFNTPWTDGCIMVRSKEEIEAIRAWLLEHDPPTIEIVSNPPVES